MQIADVRFWDWLVGIGLRPRTSLALGPLAVPDPVFIDFARGLLDGDGTVRTSLVAPNPRAIRITDTSSSVSNSCQQANSTSSGSAAN